MKFRRWAWLLVVLAFIPAFLVNRAPAPVPPSSGPRVFVEAILSNPGNLDPALATSASDLTVAENVFDPLLTMTPSGQIVPDLASSVTYQGTTVTVDVASRTVTDGSTLGAAAVAAALARPLWPEVHSQRARTLMDGVVGVQRVWSGSSRYLAGVRIINRTTLAIELKKPANQAFLANLTNPALAIVPVDNQERGGANWQLTNLYGTGGYLMTDWTPGGRLTFTQVGSGAGPHQVELLEQSSVQQAMLSFVNRVVNAVPVAPSQVSAVPAAVLAQLHYEPTPGMVSFYWNRADKGVSTYPRVSVRRWVRTAFRGRVSPGGGSWPRIGKPGQPLSLWVSDSNPVARALADQLVQLTHHQVTVRVASSATIEAMARAGRIAAYLGTASWFAKPASMKVAPMGSFWLLSDNIRHASVFPDGILDWHSLRYVP